MKMALPESHIFLRRKSVKNKLLIIGDIHGCLEETKDLLAKARYDPETTTLISVGDLVNKGP